MNNLLIDLLHGQQKTQNDTKPSIQVLHQSQKDYSYDSLIDDIHTFSCKPELYFTGC